jgi:Tfp pilus assembly protein PilO
LKAFTRRRQSWRSEIATVGLLAAFALLAFWKYHVVGGQAYIASRETRLSEARTAREKSVAAVAQRQDLEAVVGSLQRRFETVKAAFETDPDSSTFIHAIESLALTSGVTIRRFTPQSAKTGTVLTELPYRLQFSGSYHGIVAVLEAISRLRPSVQVQDVTITGRDLPLGPTAERDAVSLTAHCTLSTFCLTDQQRLLKRGTSSAVRQHSENDSDASPAVGSAARDPFANPFPTVATTAVAMSRPRGLRGVLVSETALTGILRDSGGFLAFLRAADKRTFIVRPGARLYDGIVQTVTADSVSFQTTESAVSARGSTEIIKRLRASGESGAWSRH